MYSRQRAQYHLPYCDEYASPVEHFGHGFAPGGIVLLIIATGGCEPCAGRAGTNGCGVIGVGGCDGGA